MQKKLKAKEEQKNSYQHLVQARKEARESNLTSKKSFEWLNDNSRKFLAAGYLGEGITAEERIANIAKRAEEIL